MKFVCSSSLGHFNSSITFDSGDDKKTLQQKKKKKLWLYNTMNRDKELFYPKVEGKVGMYVCGVTAYDLSNIGHAQVQRVFGRYTTRLLRASILIPMRLEESLESTQEMIVAKDNYGSSSSSLSGSDDEVQDVYSDEEKKADENKVDAKVVERQARD
ncbi:cysteine--tRNA ligase, chloroplastic/mitochondrial isoform X1 [Tanacetum coccineum]